MMVLLENLIWSSIFTSALSTAVIIFKVIAYWFLFEKAGEDGWKALIPFYSEYILCKIAKREKLFWLMLGAFGAMLIVPVLMGLGLALTGVAMVTSSAGKIFGIVLSLISYLAYLAIAILLIVISIKVSISLAEAFGQPKAFGIGLFFLEPVFVGILAFGNSEYVKEADFKEHVEPAVEKPILLEKELKESFKDEV